MKIQIKRLVWGVPIMIGDINDLFGAIPSMTNNERQIMNDTN